MNNSQTSPAADSSALTANHNLVKQRTWGGPAHPAEKIGLLPDTYDTYDVPPPVTPFRNT